jgi:hypothetical protein
MDGWMDGWRDEGREGGRVGGICYLSSDGLFIIIIFIVFIMGS